MRLVVEVRDAEIAEFQKFCDKLGASRSATLRELMRLAISGKLKVELGTSRVESEVRHNAKAVFEKWEKFTGKKAQRG